MTNKLKRITLDDLEFCDGVYNVGQIVDIDGNPWVNREMALEAIDVANSHVDWFLEEINETKD